MTSRLTRLLGYVSIVIRLKYLKSLTLEVLKANLLEH